SWYALRKWAKQRSVECCRLDADSAPQSCACPDLRARHDPALKTGRAGTGVLCGLLAVLLAELLELGEHRIHVEVLALLGALFGLDLGFRSGGRDRGRQQRRAAFLDHWLLLGGALHRRRQWPSPRGDAACRNRRSGRTTARCSRRARRRSPSASAESPWQISSALRPPSGRSLLSSVMTGMLRI